MQQKTPPNNRTLEVTVRNRQKAIYDGEALYIKSFNDRGDFAILGEHTNFISIIKNHLIIGKLDNTTEKIDLPELAVLKINKNIVEIYLGLSISQKPDEQPKTEKQK